MGFIAAAIALTATAGAGIYSSQKAANQAKKESSAASAQAAQQNAAAIQSLQTAQNTASTKAAGAVQAKQRARAGSQSIYTSPLGLTQQATVSKKTLLGQ